MNLTELLRKSQVCNEDLDLKVLQEIPIVEGPLRYIGFKVLEMKAGACFEEELKVYECCVVVLTGSVSISDGETNFENLGNRSTVFDRKPTDSLFISSSRQISIKAKTPAKIALCYSPSQKQLPTHLISASEVKIEHRGSGNNKRIVFNILTDNDTIAEKLIVVEVLTDSGNWSSYPPHKHDRDYLPEESLLEETYYHEIDPEQGFVFQRVYTEDRSVDETMTVENQNVVIVPEGYHPVGVPEGYSSYYLNVMAGPKRIWKFYNDPAHEWILKD